VPSSWLRNESNKRQAFLFSNRGNQETRPEIKFSGRYCAQLLPDNEIPGYSPRCKTVIKRTRTLQSQEDGVCTVDVQEGLGWYLGVLIRGSSTGFTVLLLDPF